MSGEYHPLKSEGDPYLQDVAALALSVDELVREYIWHAVKRGDSVRETARRLGIGRNRVQAVIHEIEARRGG